MVFLVAILSVNIPENFSVMVTLNAVSYGKGKNFWFIENAPEQQHPVILPVFFQDSDNYYRFKKGHNFVEG